MTGESFPADLARSTSIEIVEIFASLLREEERRDAFDEVFALVLAGLESFERQHQARFTEFKPSSN
jgi:hypothetical protein